MGLSTNSGCPWSAYTQYSWITFGSEVTGTGTGSIDYSVAANSGISSRAGSVTIAGQEFMVTQSGVPAGRVVFAMNSGGDEYADAGGLVYQADRYYVGG